MSDPDPREWIVVHLLDVENLTFSRDPFALGLFEIALRPEPFEGIEAALRESAHHWSILFGFDRFRIRQTLYGPPTAEAALREGWLKAKEALSVFALATHADVRIEVREAGCAVDIATGEIVLGRPLAPTQQGTMIVNDTVAPAGAGSGSSDSAIDKSAMDALAGTRPLVMPNGKLFVGMAAVIVLVTVSMSRTCDALFATTYARLLVIISTV